MKKTCKVVFRIKDGEGSITIYKKFKCAADLDEFILNWLGTHKYSIDSMRVFG